MDMMAKFGLFDEKPSAQLQGNEPVTWATFVNGIAASKGFADARDYFVKTHGEQKGLEHLRKLQRSV